MLKEGYRRVYNKDLVKTVQGELSMKTERCVAPVQEAGSQSIDLIGCSTWRSADRGTRTHMSTSNRSSRMLKRCTEPDRARLAR